MIDAPDLVASERTVVGPTPLASPAALSPVARPNDRRHIQRAWYNFSIPFTDYQFDPSWEGVKTAGGLVKDAAVAGLEWIVDEIKSLVNSGVEWLSEKWESIKEFAASAWDSAKNAFNNIVKFAKDPLGFLADALMSFDGQGLAKAWSVFSGLITKLSNGFKAMTDGFLETVNKIWGGIDGFATSLLKRISSLTENAIFKRLPDALQRMALAVVDKLNSLWKKINDSWAELFNTVKGWIDSAIDVVFSFVKKVLSFGINVLINGIAAIAQVVLFLKDLFSNPRKYLEILANKSVAVFDGVESRFAGFISKYFGASQEAAPAAAATVKVQRSPAAPAQSEVKRSATWPEIGHGIGQMMTKKWNEFKSNPLSVITGLLRDMVFPVIGDIKDIVQLFTDIKKIVTGPLSAGSLEDLWTSILKILDIPILVYNTVVSILMRTLMLPLIVATFVPHPLVKGIAAAVGYALLGAFVQGEMLNLAQKLLLLKTGSTQQAEKEEAYNRVADSLIALAMAAVITLIMLILHFIANVMKGVYSFVKGKIFKVEVAPVADSKAAIPDESKGSSPDAKGVDPEGVEEPSLDNKRKLRVTEDGQCEVCASPCDKLRRKYAREIADNPEFERRINEVETSTDSKSSKKARYRQIEQDLADARRADRLAKEPQRLRDAYADELADPDNESIKERLDAAEKITDPDAKERALADIQRDLDAAKHPTKQGAYHGQKPQYTNPGHHAPGPGFRGGGSMMTTPLPPDAEAVYQNAIPDAAGRNWYGRNASGEVYRYAPNGGSDSGVHWNGRENSPRGLVVPPEVRARFNAAGT